MFVYFRIVARAELQGTFELAIGGSEGALAYSGEFRGRINDVDGALLKLHCIATGRNRYIDQPLGDGHVAIMIDADFRDYVTRIAVSDTLTCYFDAHTMLLGHH
jgi:hypothetical protein